MIGFHGTRPSDALKRVLHETGARSVILFARNIENAAQCRELIDGIRAMVDWPLLVAVDQEGGAVVRVLEGATVFPGNMALGAANDVELARAQGRESGAQLAAMGFDLNLAPVVDLQTNPANPGIGIRSLGAQRDRAVALARALVQGHAEHGVASCLKHFPGKGAASVDAHIDLPVLEMPRSEFEEPHLRAFVELFDAEDSLSS
jgi:beta-N-acetylhexosaminidase